MMVGNSIRLSKTSIIFISLLSALILIFMWDFMAGSNSINSRFSTSGSGKVSLVNLLVASIEAAKRGGEMVKQVKSGTHLEVCNTIHLVSFLIQSRKTT